MGSNRLTTNAVRRSGDTMTGDLIVPDEAYDATGWNGSLEVPTKNAVRDKIEAMGGGSGDVVGPAGATDNAIARFDTTTGKLLQDSGVTIDDNGNMTFPSEKQIVLTANVSPDSGAISPLIKFQMTDQYDRPWIAWYDEAARLRTGMGYHTTNFADAGDHQRFEIKTSADPGGGSPTFMKTAFFLSTDGDTSDASFGYLNRLYLDKQDYVASGQWGLAWRGEDSGGTTRTVLNILSSLDASDNTLVVIDPLTAGGADDVTLRLFRGTNTSGTKLFNIYKGDDSTYVTFSVNAATGLTRITNPTDSASVQVAILEGDRATMADNDAAYVSLQLSDDGGTQSEFARIGWVATDVNAGTSIDGRLDFSVAIAGSMTAKARLESTNFRPGANDGTALGTATTSWSDLYLASGGIINFNNGNATVTHSAGLLASNVDITVPDEAYGVGWNASLEVPTKNAVYDKIEAITANLTKAITIESPTASEDISMFYTPVAITVTEMVAVLVGSSTPSVTWTVRHSTDRSAAGNEVVTSGTTTTSTTTGSVVTSFNDATIPADSFVWIETTAQSGTVGQIQISVEYTED